MLYFFHGFKISYDLLIPLFSRVSAISSCSLNNFHPVETTTIHMQFCATTQYVFSRARNTSQMQVTAFATRFIFEMREPPG